MTYLKTMLNIGERIIHNTDANIVSSLCSGSNNNLYNIENNGLNTARVRVAKKIKV